MLKTKKYVSILLSVLIIMSLISISSYSPRAVSDEIKEKINNIVGVWNGTYEGNSGDEIIIRNFKTEFLSCTEEGQLEGIVTIDKGENGSYVFSGTYDFDTSEVYFEGYKWLDNPSDFDYSAFNGTLTGKTIVNRSDSSFFSLTKTSEGKDYTISSFDDIKRNWIGEYDGFSDSFVVRRNYEIHISKIESDGTIYGKAIFSPSEKANAEYGANGSYSFKGKIEKSTGKISLKGEEWIDYPLGAGEFEFIRLDGYINDEAITGWSEEGIWEMEPINYSTSEVFSGFERGKDNNSFVHHDDANKYKKAGFKGQTDYTLNEPYYSKLNTLCKDGEWSFIKQRMHDEWEGSCYGIALSMGLLYEKYINACDLGAKSFNTNYYNLGKPCENSTFRSMITYYQLSQYIKSVGNDAVITSTANSPLFRGIRNWIGKDESLSVFLKNLVKNIQNNHVAAFSFNTKSEGHSILVVGCKHIDSDNKYLVTMYDENSVGDDNPKGSFSYMTIDDDYSGFALTNHKGEVELTEKNYVYMDLVSWDKLGSLIPQNRNRYSDTKKLIVPLNNKYVLENDYGETLEYGENGFEGDMPIYSFDSICEDNEGDDANALIEVGNSEFFNIEFKSKENEIRIIDDDEYLSLSGKNIDSAKLDFNEGISIKGEDYDFNAHTSNLSKKEESDMVSFSGHADKDINITNYSDFYNIESDGKINNIKTAGYYNNIYETYTYNSASNNSLTMNSKAKIKELKEVKHTVKKDNGEETASTKKTTPVPKLKKTSVKLKAGKTSKITVNNKGKNKVTYKSTNKKVATVKNGKVTALKKGKANIMVTVGKTKLTYKVNVISSPKLNKKSVSVKKGKTITVKITGKASGVNNKYTNTKYAKIKSKKSATKLKIKGIKKGKTTLKIKVNGVTLKLKVKVK